MAHLLKYDSVLGMLPDRRSRRPKNGITRRRRRAPGAVRVRDPAELPWGDLGVDVVVESTGIFTAKATRPPPTSRPAPRSSSCRRRATGADATFVSASTTPTSTPSSTRSISNASCTTNCFVPMVKVLDDAFGVEQGLMTTIHAYTGDQKLVDGPHSDLRRARAAAINIIPTSTGAARATSLVLESMKGKLDGTSLRVPVPDRLGHRLQRHPDRRRRPSTRSTPPSPRRPSRAR